MAQNESKRPIGFNRADPDPNGTGDGWRLNEREQEPEQGPPPRHPKAAPAYVGTSEGLTILAAYDLFALTPLSNLEQQLLQVVAGLEKRIEELV